MKIGIMSDTHGIFFDEWTEYLKDCDVLIHAGDVNTLRCYEEIKSIGVPLYAVRGNCDYEEVAGKLPEFLSVPIGGKIFYIVHKETDLPFDLTEADFVIFGHTHCYTYYERFGKVFINPGSPLQARDGNRGFVLLELDGDKYRIQRVSL